MEDIVTKLFMNNVKSTMIESFKNLPDEMKNEEFAKTFRELDRYKAKEKELREYVETIKSSGINSHFDAEVIKKSVLDILDKE
jgi:hypothetical protein